MHEDGGVYAAPEGITALRDVYRGPGDAWRTIDLAGARDKASLLAAVARMLGFPASFGQNWDALADALQDLSWLQWSRLVLEVSGAEALQRVAPQDWATALEIFRDAATYWASHRKTLLVLVQGAAGLPALPERVRYKTPVSVLVVMGLLASAGFTHIGLVTDVAKPKPEQH